MTNEELDQKFRGHDVIDTTGGHEWCHEGHDGLWCRVCFAQCVMPDDQACPGPPSSEQIRALFAMDDSVRRSLKDHAKVTTASPFQRAEAVHKLAMRSATPITKWHLAHDERYWDMPAMMHPDDCKCVRAGRQEELDAG